MGSPHSLCSLLNSDTASKEDNKQVRMLLISNFAAHVHSQSTRALNRSQTVGDDVFCINVQFSYRADL